MSRTGTKSKFRLRSGERGQTIILVAVSLVTLLAMAALAIDVVTLYVARSEMQRAADAAALAGAKAFVDSGLTSLAPTDPSYANRQALAQNMAATVISSILPQNRVSGAPPLLAAGSPAIDLTRAGNPQVTVTLQRTDLPTFFARIWGTRLATITATAVAEAYNPANAPAGYPPIAPKCVKPLLVDNKDPVSTQPFVDPVTGLPTALNVIGEGMTLCPTGSPCVNPTPLRFRPALVTPSAANLCPATCNPPASDYESSIECCDSATVYACGGTPNPIANPVTPQVSIDTNNGFQCVTKYASADSLNPASIPGFSAGTSPVEITSLSSLNPVTTSSSIVTLPIVPPTGPVTVVGFLQVFIDPVPVAAGSAPTAHILNVIGCGNSPGPPPPVLGGGYSPIPVRLIHQ